MIDMLRTKIRSELKIRCDTFLNLIHDHILPSNE